MWLKNEVLGIGRTWNFKPSEIVQLSRAMELQDPGGRDTVSYFLHCITASKPSVHRTSLIKHYHVTQNGASK